MKPIRFKMADASLGAPSNFPFDCEALPIMRAHNCIYSCWQPSWGERLQLLIGKPVQLVVASSVTMPPVALGVGEPSDKGGA